MIYFRLLRLRADNILGNFTKLCICPIVQKAFPSSTIRSENFTVTTVSPNSYYVSIKSINLAICTARRFIVIDYIIIIME